MAEKENKIIPNSFQIPNFYVDVCMRYLSGNEFQILAFLARKTFGWHKRSDRVAKTQVVSVTGLNA